MYYSVKEVADLLHCDRETVRRWVRTKKLKAIKVNLEFKIREEDLLDLLKNKIVGIDLNGKTLTEILEFI